MFHFARLKLTAWYLGIIMAISFLFSLVIYMNINTEFRRFEKLQEIIAKEENTLPPPLYSIRLRSPRLDMEAIGAARTRLITALGIINFAILGLAGSAGYFLAGRTLRPIKDMVDEQNRFIGDASHELKTPLTSLKSAFEVHLRNKKRTLKEADELVTESIVEVNKLQSLSESLLTLVQFRQANGTAQIESVDLRLILTQAVRKVAPMAKQKRITIKDETYSVSVQGNKEQLAELFVILLDNAVKYSKSKTTILLTTITTEHKVIVSVSDEGIGIAPKDIPHIFDRFYRSDAARSRNGSGGYGLGLAIAQHIALLHDGVVTVTSKTGRGSTFSVTLPLRFS